MGNLKSRSLPTYTYLPTLCFVVFWGGMQLVLILNRGSIYIVYYIIYMYIYIYSSRSIVYIRVVKDKDKD